jgi:protease-4
MIFARKVWNLLVGIKDALVLVMALMFFLVLFGADRAGPFARGAQRSAADPPGRAGGRGTPGSIRPRC